MTGNRMAICVALLCIGFGTFTERARGADQLIDFDGLTAHSFISNEFSAQGALFQGANIFEVRNDTFTGTITLPSSPNVAAIAGTGSIVFADPLNSSVPATTDHFQFDNPGLVSSGSFFAGLTITLYGLNDSVLTSTQIPYVGPLQARSAFTSSFDIAGIHRVQFDRIEHPDFPGFVAIDNVRFSAVVVPEPGTGLCVLGIMAAILGRRRVPGDRRMGGTNQ